VAIIVVSLCSSISSRDCRDDKSDMAKEKQKQKQNKMATIFMKKSGKLRESTIKSAVNDIKSRFWCLTITFGLLHKFFKKIYIGIKSPE